MYAPVEPGLICDRDTYNHCPHKSYSLIGDPDINKVFTQINAEDKYGECHEVQM